MFVFDFISPCWSIHSHTITLSVLLAVNRFTLSHSSGINYHTSLFMLSLESYKLTGIISCLLYLLSFVSPLPIETNEIGIKRTETIFYFLQSNPSPRTNITEKSQDVNRSIRKRPTDPGTKHNLHRATFLGSRESTASRVQRCWHTSDV